MLEDFIIVAAGSFAGLTLAIVLPYRRSKTASADLQPSVGTLHHIVLAASIVITSALILGLLRTQDTWNVAIWLASTGVSCGASYLLFSRTRMLPATPTHGSMVLAWTIVGTVLILYVMVAPSIASHACQRLAKRGCLPGMTYTECRRAQDLQYCIDSLTSSFP
jgi:hypothetical protein